jgi:uncharacterized protein (TIGR00369 family)
MVISGGENVYPAEVEAALRSHPAVADAAVIGIPDERWGEAVHAVVVLQRCARGTRARRCATSWSPGAGSQLAGYKCPRSIEFSAALPLSAAGKVLKNQLRADAAKGARVTADAASSHAATPSPACLSRACSACGANFSDGGRARSSSMREPELENVIGAMHGGVVATLLDVAMASAAVSKVDFEMTAVTLSMNSTFIRPGHGRLTADGSVLAVDDAVALCEACVVDEDGDLVARAIGSLRYLPHR